MMVAALLAVIFCANISLSIALVWITNPITMGPIFYFTYKLGCIILDTRIDPHFSFSWPYLKDVLVIGFFPLLIGSLVVASISAVIGYMTTYYRWK